MIELTPIQKRFVLRWGEIGTRSGINPSMAEVHALLIVTPRPLSSEEISRALSISRSSVSNSLRELQGLGLIRLVRLLGDRQDRFEALEDTWEACLLILEVRKRREIDPAMEALRSCIGEATQAGRPEERTRRRLEELLQFYEALTEGYRWVRRLPKALFLRRARQHTRPLKVVDPK